MWLWLWPPNSLPPSSAPPGSRSHHFSSPPMFVRSCERDSLLLITSLFLSLTYLTSLTPLFLSSRSLFFAQWLAGMEQTQDGGGVGAEAEAQGGAGHAPRHQVGNSPPSFPPCASMFNVLICTPTLLMPPGSVCPIRGATASPLCCRPAARWLPSQTTLGVSRCCICPGACACACGRVRPRPLAKPRLLTTA